MADTIDTLKSVASDADKILNSARTFAKMTGKTSATRLTKDQIFQFPIIMDADIDNDEKFPLIKSIEKNYASLIMIAITNEGFVDRDKYPNINDFLKRFHNNGDSSFIEDFTPSKDSFNLVEAIVTEGYLSKEEMEEIWMTADEGMDTESINDMYKPYQRTAAKITRAIESALAAKKQLALEATDDLYFRAPVINKVNGRRIAETDKSGKIKYEYYLASKNPNGEKYQRDLRNYGEPKTLADWGDRDYTQKIVREDEVAARKRADQLADRAEDRANKLADRTEDRENDLRKERNMVRGNVSGSMVRDDTKFATLAPTMLSITLANAKKTEGNWSQQLLIGVKAMPRMIPQSLMINNMIEACKDRPIFTFIKWTKGELTFKEMLFGINAARNDAKYGTRWLKVLRKRAKKNNGRFVGVKSNPNTTIIITESDVHMIFEKCGVNLNDPSNVNKLMDKYFLLGFGIYDTEGKMLKIMYDGESEFTHQSLRSMIADTKKEQNLLQMGRY